MVRVESQRLVAGNEVAGEEHEVASEKRPSHRTYRVLVWYSSVMQVFLSLVLLVASVLYIVTAFKLANALFQIRIGLIAMCGSVLIFAVSVAGVIGLAKEKATLVCLSVILWCASCRARFSRMDVAHCAASMLCVAATILTDLGL